MSFADQYTLDFSDPKAVLGRLAAPRNVLREFEWAKNINEMQRTARSWQNRSRVMY